MALKEKQLINVTEQHKKWIKDVVAAAQANNQETNQTDIIRTLLDQAMIQDPETFVQHLSKMRTRARLEDVSRREAALKEEKERLLGELQAEGQLTAAR